MRFLITTGLMILISCSYEALGIEFNYNKTIYKNKKGEQFASVNNCRNWTKLQGVQSLYNLQVYTNKVRATYISGDAGNTWKKLSNPSILEPQGLIEIEIAPNPTGQILNIKFESEVFAKAEIEIYDYLGTLKLKTDETNVIKGLNEINIELGNMPANSYFLTVIISGIRHTANFTVIK